MAQSLEIRHNFFKRPPGFPNRTLRYIIRYMNRKDTWAQPEKRGKKVMLKIWILQDHYVGWIKHFILSASKELLRLAL